jgi:hypothetical protein
MSKTRPGTFPGSSLQISQYLPSRTLLIHRPLPTFIGPGGSTEADQGRNVHSASIVLQEIRAFPLALISANHSALTHTPYPKEPSARFSGEGGTPNRSIFVWFSGIQNNRGVGQFASAISAVVSRRSLDHPVSRRPFLIMKRPAFIKIFELPSLKSDQCKDCFQRSVCIQNMMII